MAELAYTLLKLVPKNTYSRLVGAACRLNVPAPMMRAVIRNFAKSYGVNAEESERPIEEYPTFVEFFTRRLKPGARPIAPGAVAISPVDGTVAEKGEIVDSTLYQAKGKPYTLAELIGGPEAEADAKQFAGGTFCTIYLAPHNYHRIHTPLAGEITGYVEKLFCVNERLTTFLKTPRGPCAVVSVGATAVGRIRAVYDDVVTNAKRTRRVTRKMYDQPIPVEKGGELAIFEMGSTVVLLFAPGVKINSNWQAGMPIKLGEALE
jgi:phosphatidylserine decarboxylase